MLRIASKVIGTALLAVLVACGGGEDEAKATVQPVSCVANPGTCQ